VESTLDTQPNTRKRDAHLSKDGKWRSFPKVPHLLQYVGNNNYYGRIKVSDKIIRESSDTDVWTTVKLRLVDFLKEHGESKPRWTRPSEALWVTWDDIDWKRKEIIVRGDPITATKNSETRRMPLIPDMELFLNRLKDNLGTVGKERILQVSRGHESLARACRELGIP
jgi:hypothetical protein